MSSLVRRIQRAHNKELRHKPSTIPNFGTQLGYTNLRAKDLVARLAREARHATA